MAEHFDPYHQWLGISPKDQPPNHYRLLGIDPFEPNPSVIETAADQRMTHLRTFQAGKNSALSQKLLNEVAAAKVCLLSPKKKAAHDAWLREQARASGVKPKVAGGGKPSAPAGGSGLDGTLAALLKAEKVAAPISRTRSAKRVSLNPSIVLKVAVGGGVILLGLMIWAMTQRADSTRFAHVNRPSSMVPESAADGKHEWPSASDQPPGDAPPKPTPPAKPEVAPPAVPIASVPASESPSPQPTEPAPMDDLSFKNEPGLKAELADKATLQAVEGSNRQAVPPPAAQEEVDKQLHDLYRIDDIQHPAERKLLARELIDLAQRAAKPEERYVMLRTAAEQAGKADDMVLMLKAIDRLCGQFDLDPLVAKKKMLAKLAAGATSTARIKVVVEGFNTVIDQAVAAGQLDLAMDLADKACQMCQKPQGSPCRRQMVDRHKEIEKLQGQFDLVGKALVTVQTNPTDVGANQTLGQWYCFTMRDWTKGLPYLANGSDVTLKALAAQETDSPPGDPEEQIKLAEGWWNVGREARGRSRRAIQLHAGAWYRQAQSRLPDSLLRRKVDKRLGEIAALGPETAELPGKPPAPPPVLPDDEKATIRLQDR